MICCPGLQQREWQVYALLLYSCFNANKLYIEWVDVVAGKHLEVIKKNSLSLGLAFNFLIPKNYLNNDTNHEHWVKGVQYKHVLMIFLCGRNDMLECWMTCSLILTQNTLYVL